MKTLILSLLISVSAYSQDEVEVLTMKPYLIEEDPVSHALTVSGASNLRLNRALGHTQLDTIFCKVEILDSISGVRVGSSRLNLSGYISYWIESKALPKADDDTLTISPFWDLYTVERPMRLIRSLPGVRIVRVIEIGGRMRAGRSLRKEEDTGKSLIEVENGPEGVTFETL